MELRTHLSALIASAGALLLLAAPSSHGARQGTVHIEGGDPIHGEIRFEDDRIIVQPAGGEPVEIQPGGWTEIRFEGAAAEGAGESESPAEPPSDEVLQGWTVTRIGTGPTPEAVPISRGFALRGGGAGLKGNSDAVSIVHAPMEATGQLMARLDSFDGASPEAAAGLMLRDNLGEAAAYAFVGHRAGSGISFQYRQIAGGMTMRLTNVVQDLPAWLRIARVGGAVVAEVSPDGARWHPIGRANVNLGREIVAGMAVSSGADDAVVTAEFRSPSLGARGSSYMPAAGYPRLVSRGGSILVAPIRSADEAVVRLGGALDGSLVSVLNLARIEFAPLTPDVAERLEQDRQGLLLADGDFLVGSIRSISTNRITMSSILFGFRDFSIGSEAAAVQLGPVEAEDAAFRIRLHDGSDIRARTVQFASDTLRAQSPLLGSLTIHANAIEQMSRR